MFCHKSQTLKRYVISERSPSNFNSKSKQKIIGNEFKWAQQEPKAKKTSRNTINSIQKLRGYWCVASRDCVRHRFRVIIKNFLNVTLNFSGNLFFSIKTSRSLPFISTLREKAKKDFFTKTDEEIERRYLMGLFAQKTSRDIEKIIQEKDYFEKGILKDDEQQK